MDLEPGLEALEAPPVHPDLASFAAFASAHKHRTASGVKIALGERERFTDPEARAPEHDDHPAQPDPLRLIPGGAHDRDYLFHGWRVGWVAQALVARPW